MKKVIFCLMIILLILCSCESRPVLNNSEISKSTFALEYKNMIYYIFNGSLYSKQNLKETPALLEFDKNYSAHSMLEINGSPVAVFTKQEKDSTSIGTFKTNVAFYDVITKKKIKNFNVIGELDYNIIYFDNKIYYKSGNGVLWVMDNNDSSTKISENIKDYNIQNSKVFYLKNDSICSNNLNGTQEILLFKDSQISAAGFYENNVIGMTDNGTEFFNLTTNTKSHIEQRLCVWLNIYHDDYVIAASFNDKGIYKVKIDGQNLQKISDVICGRISLSDKYIYMELSGQEQEENSGDKAIDSIYRMNLDGSSPEKIH